MTKKPTPKPAGTDTVTNPNAPEVLAPGHTELMVDPDTLDAWPAENPLAADADHDGHNDTTGQFVSPNPGRAGADGQPLPATDPYPVIPWTVGRMVHYYANAAAGPVAAIITYVGADTVHLTLFPPSGLVTGVKDVPYVDNLLTDGAGWRWPPGSPAPAPVLANIGDVPGATGNTVFGVSKDELRGRRG